MDFKASTGPSARWLSVLTGVLLSLSGCGGGGGGGTYCCVLQYLARVCASPNNSDGLNKSIADWKKVGDTEDDQACGVLVNSKDLGCYGSFGKHDETEAIASCSN